ncbi:MAG: ABC transporter substrate-binding protein [Firmicutes bacterium]|nr:ABC transporter substrate-binding protein [Bacillota bacterium]
MWIACICLCLFLLFGMAAVAKTTLELWTKFADERLAPHRMLMEEYERLNPDIKIEYATVTGDYSTKLVVAIAAGAAPDVAQVFPTLSIPEFAHKGLIQPLDRFMTAAGIKANEFAPGAYESWRYDGKTWAMTCDIDVNMFYWHKEIFAREGLDPDAYPVTIDELDSLARRLTRTDGSGNLTRLGFVPWLGDWLTWAAPWNVEWYDAETRTVTADHTNAVAMMEWMASYALRYEPGQINALTARISNYHHGDAFLKELLAMQVTGPWLIGDMYQFAPGQWGMAPLPYPQQGLPNASTGNALTFVIPTGAKHPEEAFKFIHWRTDFEQSMKLLDMGRSHVPVRIQALRAFVRRFPDYLPVLDVLTGPNLKPFMPMMPVSAEYSRELRWAVDQVRSLQMTPQAALAQVTQRVQVRLDETLGK